MKFRPLLLCVVCLCSALLAVGREPPTSARKTHSFDATWQFLKSDAAGAEKPEFDDASWRTLNLPHDWSIEGPFDEKNPTGGAGGFLPSGVAWYRKQFKLDDLSANSRYFIEFDGVMENSDVWINGIHLGKRPNGYVSFRYELTEHLKKGMNIIAVRADTSAQPASRWYSGAGIYRHVRLIEMPKVSLVLGETQIVTSEISEKSAMITVHAKATNQSGKEAVVSSVLKIRDPAQTDLATQKLDDIRVKAGESVDLNFKVTLKNPALWSIEQPHLLTAVVTCNTDRETVRFGVRDARFEADTGFWLNGKNLKIKGVCLHHDAGAFGAAVPLEIWRERLARLKSLGVNAIRTAHHPMAPEFLDLCDQMGFLVMDEFFDCWTVAKNPHDYSKSFKDWWERDLRDTVLRDRNHPSIILYSAGNEIKDTPQEKLAYGILSDLVAAYHKYDPTRPVTQALFRPNHSHDFDNGLADLLDVIGTNYRDVELLAAQKAKPTRKIIGTEQSHDRKVWLRCRDNPQHAGQFLWTGIDYVGESRKWPIMASGSGLLDKTGTIRAMAWERASWWSDQPVLKIVRRKGEWKFAPADPGFTPLDRSQVVFADWTSRNAEPHEETVEIYSNCETVELFLNDKSLGAQNLPADASPRAWKVAYAPGTLKAIGRNGNKIVANDELRTAGPAAAIQLTTHRAKLTPGFDNVAIVTATVVDANGVRVPDATPLVQFNAEGPGKIVAVDNADITSHEPYQSTQYKAFEGTCVAYVRATDSKGAITIKAEAEGLKAGSIQIETARPAIFQLKP
ncbi:MAG: glycoside hydrolase family 2 TIM barrel-domain containing protein [Nibricoccus sp.]